MYLLTFLAVPTPEAREFHESAGAYVNCWIRDDDRQSAEQRARNGIQEYGWSVESLEGEAVVTGADYGADDEDREFYEQALMEGEVLVFTTWPHGDEEDDDEGYGEEP